MKMQFEVRTNGINGQKEFVIIAESSADAMQEVFKHEAYYRSISIACLGPVCQ